MATGRLVEEEDQDLIPLDGGNIVVEEFPYLGKFGKNMDGDI